MSFKKTIIKECIASDKNNRDNGLSYEAVKEIADHILNSSKHKPKIGIICGSGLGSIADKLVNSEVLPYESIPNFPVTSVPGHAGRLVLGILSGVPVLCLQGRVHYYEGQPLSKCVLCVRVMKLMGIENLIVSNAAGGLNPNYKVGDIMILKDHINTFNFGGNSPLRGINDTRFGPLYPSMTNAYDKHLRQCAKKCATEAGFTEFVHEGIYTMMAGPMFETPAELKALRILGTDAVGMSTTPEVVAARHCGIRVFSFSLITNVCVTDEDSEEETVADTDKIGSYRMKEIMQLVTHICLEMAKPELILETFACEREKKPSALRRQYSIGSENRGEGLINKDTK
ncbi:UNVERIFIED_CONTAM: hypothetical protein RMT77_008087 [Armadillidium vulgare]